jgi:serine/threonine protein kinase
MVIFANFRDAKENCWNLHISPPITFCVLVDAQKGEQAFMIGSYIYHYKILQMLGSGGMGVVYKAEDTRLGRLVAIKFLPPSLTAGSEEKERFIIEAQAASSLDHPNICTIYEINETEFGQMYIALAFYEGETLKTRIEKSPIESQESIRIAIQIAQGLAKAHGKGIVHRDIKPANIVITPESIAKILDFGLAKLAANSRITKSHSTLGTVAYMSPEQMRGDDVDQRADLWSLGVVLYEMVTGHLPFRGDSEAALIYRITNEEPILAQSWRPDLDPRLAAILGHCLEKDPAERYQNADELIQDLQICLRPQAEPKPENRLVALHRPAKNKHAGMKRRWPWLAGVSVLTGLLILAFVLTRSGGQFQQHAPAAASKDGNLSALADGLTIQILTQYTRAPAERPGWLAGMSTQSLPALKAYLEAIKKERRGDMGGAYRLYSLAIQYDSTFSLAWFRRANFNQMWQANPTQARTDIDNAIFYGEKLPLRDRRLIWAQEALIKGENENALTLARLVLDEDPDDILALSVLATCWPRVANLYGHSLLENREAEKRLLALDPASAVIFQGLSAAALERGDITEIDSLLARWKQMEHQFLPAWALEMGRLHLTEDWSNRQMLFQKMSSYPSGTRLRGVEYAVAFARDIANAAPAARLFLRKSEPSAFNALGYWLLATIETGCGRSAKAASRTDSLAALLPEYEMVFHGLALPIRLYLIPDAIHAVNVASIRQWQPHPRTAAAGWEGSFGSFNDLLPHFRWYHLGVLSFFQGDTSQLGRCRQRLATEVVRPDAASLVRIWGNTLQALAKMYEGQNEIALQFLERESPIIRYPLTNSPIFSLAFTRYLRAELLLRLGRNEEALNWYRSLTELLINDIPYRGPAFLRMAEIYEKIGRPQEAIQHYEKFLFLWRECAPEYKTITAAAAKRLQTLKAQLRT